MFSFAPFIWYFRIISLGYGIHKGQWSNSFRCDSGVDGNNTETQI